MTIRTLRTVSRISDLSHDWAVVARQRITGRTGRLLTWDYNVPADDLRDATERGHLVTVQRRDPDGSIVLLARRPKAKG